jgi:Flp pilus assembly protein TadG
MNHPHPDPPRKQTPCECVVSGEGRDRGSVSTELVIATPFLILLLVFVAVVIHRGVDARLRLDDVAHQAARAASLARSPSAATEAAQQQASQALASSTTCRQPSVVVDTSQFVPGGLVTVTVRCTVDFADAAPFLPAGGKNMSATASSPIDPWRAVTGTPEQTTTGTKASL